MEYYSERQVRDFLKIYGKAVYQSEAFAGGVMVPESQEAIKKSIRDLSNIPTALKTTGTIRIVKKLEEILKR